MGQKCDGSDRSWAGMETAKPLTAGAVQTYVTFQGRWYKQKCDGA